MPPERRQRGQPTGWTPDTSIPGHIPVGPDEKISFGTHRVCSNCKGKKVKRGQPCGLCGGSGFERIG